MSSFLCWPLDGAGEPDWNFLLRWDEALAVCLPVLGARNLRVLSPVESCASQASELGMTVCLCTKARIHVLLSVAQAALWAAQVSVGQEHAV